MRSSLNLSLEHLILLPQNVLLALPILPYPQNLCLAGAVRLGGSQFAGYQYWRK